jgi:hypothetical protein
MKQTLQDALGRTCAAGSAVCDVRSGSVPGGGVVDFARRVSFFGVAGVTGKEVAERGVEVADILYEGPRIWERAGPRRWTLVPCVDPHPMAGIGVLFPTYLLLTAPARVSVAAGETGAPAGRVLIVEGTVESAWTSAKSDTRVTVRCDEQGRIVAVSVVLGTSTQGPVATEEIALSGFGVRVDVPREGWTFEGTPPTSSDER